MAMKMKKSMKAMKMASAMKMKMKAMKVSKIAKGKRAKSSVFRGSKVKTTGGLKKTDLKKSKTGKVVSIKASNASKRRYKNSKASKWIDACVKARKALGVKGFAAVGGKSKGGQALLSKARSFYKK